MTSPDRPQSFALFAARVVKRIARVFGVSIQLAPFPRGTHTIRDAELYDPRFQPWLSAEWRSRLREADRRSALPLAARYVLYTTLVNAKYRAGDVAECGVYRGGSAFILAGLLADTGKRLCLFDSFRGIPHADPSADLHKSGDFGDTSVEQVKTYLAPFERVDVFVGLIPASLTAVADRTFCFVHIDLDVYDAMLSASEFFYPRISEGGIIVYDDYGVGDCPGARRAVDEFYEGKPEVPLVLQTGQCIVIKK